MNDSACRLVAENRQGSPADSISATDAKGSMRT
jgi:hypothetical protein